MPRFVDHAARRAELSDALWRVVRSSGIQAVSVRTVAAEAGTSPSALRHYFSSTDELLGFGLTAVVERVERRLLGRWSELTGGPGGRTILEQFLPLDEERRNEIEVYLAFIGRAHTDPALRLIRDTADNRALEGVRHALELLAAAGEVGVGRDLTEETSRLYALVDGLAMHGALMPERYPPAHQRHILERHLVDLRQDVENPPAASSPG